MHLPDFCRVPELRTAGVRRFRTFNSCVEGAIFKGNVEARVFFFQCFATAVSYGTLKALVFIS